MSDLAFQTQIYADLEELPNRLTFPDKSNKGKMYALLFMWKRVQQLAEKKYDSHMKMLQAEELLDDPQKITTPGNHTLGDSGAISVVVNVSVPRREFNVDWLAKEMKKKYKVPEAMTKALVEEAKRPGATQVRRITVQEKGMNL
jgi:hypothetical protein